MQTTLTVIITVIIMTIITDKSLFITLFVQGDEFFYLNMVLKKRQTFVIVIMYNFVKEKAYG